MRKRLFVLVALASVLHPSHSAAQTELIRVDSVRHWSLAAVGDVIMNRRIVQFDHPGDTAFYEMANLIRNADVAFMNLEQSVFSIDDPTIWPAAETGGGYTRADPIILQDLAQLGLDLFNRANNHTTDWGVLGMRATDSLLDQMGLVHAGTGENLGLASRAAYLETPKGRFALIGMASTFTAMSPAGLASASVRGRPGLNPLRIHHINYAKPTTMEAVREAAVDLGLNPDGEVVRVYRTDIKQGDTTRIWDSLAVEGSARVLREVRNASDQADYVIVNSHSHDPANIVLDPPEWIQLFAKEVIDAGATAFIVEGPHQLRGVEIYKGRPIFYSLGNFVFQIQTIAPLPADVMLASGLPLDASPSEVYDVQSGVDENGAATKGFAAADRWWRSVVVVMDFVEQEIEEIRFYPIHLGRLEPRADRGTPRLADGDLAEEIITQLQNLSRPFGTEIVFENGIGVWHRPAG